MNEPCRSCGSSKWHAKRTRYEGESLSDWCSECPQAFQATPVHDVYFTGEGTHYGIYNPETGEPVYITSRAHKAYEMKKQGLQEAGDRHHGSNGFDPISHRHAVESLRK